MRNGANMRYEDLSHEERAILRTYVVEQSTLEGRVKQIKEKYILQLEVMRAELNNHYWNKNEQNAIDG